MGDIKIDKERVKEQIQKVLSGEMEKADSILILEHTPDILKQVGLKDHEILFSQRHLKNCLHEKGKNPHWHGLMKEHIVSLPEQFQNPVMIMDSFSDDYSVLMVTEQVDGDKLPIMASIRANGKGSYECKTITSNYLTSVYGKDKFDNFLERSLDADFMLYANKEKIQNLETLSELHLLGKFTNDFGFNQIIHESKNIVNEEEIEKKSVEIKSKKICAKEFFREQAGEKYQGFGQEDILRMEH